MALISIFRRPIVYLVGAYVAFVQTTRWTGLFLERIVLLSGAPG